MESASLNRDEVCKLLQKAVLNLCQKQYSAWSSNIEVDGIICISATDSCEQHVVKIHEKLGNDRNMTKLKNSKDISKLEQIYRDGIEEINEAACDKSSQDNRAPPSESNEFKSYNSICDVEKDASKKQISEMSHAQVEKTNRRANVTESVEGDYVIVKLEQSDEEESRLEIDLGQRSGSSFDPEEDQLSVKANQEPQNNSSNSQISQNGLSKQSQEGRIRNRKLAVPTRRVKPPPQMYFSIDSKDNSIGIDTHYDHVEDLDEDYQSFHETFAAGFTVSPGSSGYEYRKPDVDPVKDGMEIPDSGNLSISNSQGFYRSEFSRRRSFSAKKKYLNISVKKEQGALSPGSNQSFNSGSEFDTSLPFTLNPEHRYSCRFCGKGFTLKCTKVRHEKTICGGGGVAMYQCNLCEKSFTRSDSRCRHMLKTHGISSAELDTWTKTHF